MDIGGLKGISVLPLLCFSLLFFPLPVLCLFPPSLPSFSTLVLLCIGGSPCGLYYSYCISLFSSPISLIALPFLLFLLAFCLLILPLALCCCHQKARWGWATFHSVGEGGDFIGGVRVSCYGREERRGGRKCLVTGLGWIVGDAWLLPSSGQPKIMLASAGLCGAAAHGAEVQWTTTPYLTAVKPVPACLCPTDFLKTRIWTFALFCCWCWTSISIKTILTLASVIYHIHCPS